MNITNGLLDDVASQVSEYLTHYIDGQTTITVTPNMVESVLDGLDTTELRETFGSSANWVEKLIRECAGKYEPPGEAAALGNVVHREKKWAAQFPGGDEAGTFSAFDAVTADDETGCIRISDIGIMADEFGDISLTPGTADTLGFALILHARAREGLADPRAYGLTALDLLHVADGTWSALGASDEVSEDDHWRIRGGLMRLSDAIADIDDDPA